MITDSPLRHNESIINKDNHPVTPSPAATVGTYHTLEQETPYYYEIHHRNHSLTLQFIHHIADTPVRSSIKVSLPISPNLRDMEEMVDKNCVSTSLHMHPTFLVLFQQFEMTETGKLLRLKTGCNYNTMNMTVIHEIVHSGLNNKYLPPNVIKKHPTNYGRDSAYLMIPHGEVSVHLSYTFHCYGYLSRHPNCLIHHLLYSSPLPTIQNQM